MNSLSQKLVDEVKLAVEYKRKLDRNEPSLNKGSSLALAYEKARNAVEYRDEHLIRQAAIERILTRRLFLNQSSEKIASLLYKELIWARYVDTTQDQNLIYKLEKIITKYREAGLLIPNSTKSKILTGICACEIDEALNFEPINQIIINYVTQVLNKQIFFETDSPENRELQIYIAVERGFAKNSEMLIRYKLLKVLLPKWDDGNKLLLTLDAIEQHLNHEYKDLLRRKVVQLAPPLRLISDFVLKNQSELDQYFNQENNTTDFIKEITDVLEQRYKSTRNKLITASKRSIIYIFLTKMVFALLIEIPFDLILGSINYVVLSINILFPPSLMILFNSKVSLPSSDNTKIMIDKVNKYMFKKPEEFEKETIEINKITNKMEKIFYYVFLVTSIALVLGIVYFLTILDFNFISQIIFLFFLSVVSFFAFRVREISKEYLISQVSNESFLETLTDYLFLPIIKIGQWLSSQVSKINVLSFIFDFIIEAPLKTFLEIFEQWLHFVRVKKEEFLG